MNNRRRRRRSSRVSITKHNENETNSIADRRRRRRRSSHISITNHSENETNYITHRRTEYTAKDYEKELKTKTKALEEIEVKKKKLKKEIGDMKKKKLKERLSIFEKKNSKKKYKHNSDSDLISMILMKTKKIDEDTLSVFDRDTLLELLGELNNKGGRPIKKKEKEIVLMEDVKNINRKGIIKWRKVINFENFHKSYEGWNFKHYKTVYT